MNIDNVLLLFGLLKDQSVSYRNGRFSRRSRFNIDANDKVRSNAVNIDLIDDFPPYQPSNLGLIN